MTRESDEAVRAALRQDAILRPQAPPSAHETRILDGGWRINPGVSPMGGPAIIISAVDGTVDFIYPFRDLLHFAEFRGHSEELAKAFRTRQEAGQDNGEPEA